MSFLKLTRDLFEVTSMVLRPDVTYIAHPDKGVTGNITVGARTSNRKKLPLDEFDIVEGVAGQTIGAYDEEVAEAALATNFSVSDSIFKNPADSNNPFKFGAEHVVPGHVVPTYFLKVAEKKSLFASRKIQTISASFFDYDTSYTHLSPNVNSHEQYPFESLSQMFMTTTSPYIDNPMLQSKDAEQELFKHHANDDPSAQLLFSLNYLSASASPTPTNFDSKTRGILRNSFMKRHITDNLMHHYKSRYNHCEFSYGNYLTLNFYTGSHSENAALYYNDATHRLSTTGMSQGTVAFWVNVRDGFAVLGGNEHRAGTVITLGSCLAMSIVTGSSRDANGEIDAYRILLQTRESAEIPPHKIKISSAENPAILDRYITEDNIIKKNHWHHVSFRFSKDKSVVQGGSQLVASLKVDNKDKEIILPGIINNKKSGAPTVNQRDIVLGNFPVTSSTYSAATLAFRRQKGGLEATAVCNNVNPLNAEIHDVKIYTTYLSDARLDQVSKKDVENYDDDRCVFHVGPYFVKDPGTIGCQSFANPDLSSPGSLSVLNRSGFLLNPSQMSDEFTSFDAPNDDFYTGDNRQTTSPFNPRFSMGIGGRLINLNNFVTNLAGRYRFQNNTSMQKYVIAYHMTASWHPNVLNPNIQATTINVREYIYENTSGVYGNTLILPNDNGLFKPNYHFIKSDEEKMSKNQGRHSYRYKNEFSKATSNDIPSYDKVSLRNLLVDKNNYNDDSKLLNRLESNLDIGFFPSDFKFAGGRYPIAYLTRDLDSHDVSIFNVSNLFYGERIHPGSLTIQDTGLTGSKGRVKLKFKDDSRGSIYRADCLTDHAKWNSHGNVFYDEGIVFMKSPHPPYFGKNGYRLDFKGEQTTHVFTINVPCPKNMIHSSSNPTYQLLSSSLSPADENNKFVYITGVNIHDENFNVIMRANLAQPIKKRKTDGFMFRIKQDF